jgi:transcriptional regulator with XRE-family HTH domain
MEKAVLMNSDELYRYIGQNVARIRKAKKMTQLDLALAIGLKSVGLVSVAEIYHNKKHFNIEHLYKIAAVLEVDIGEFFKLPTASSNDDALD